MNQKTLAAIAVVVTVSGILANRYITRKGAIDRELKNEEFATDFARTQVRRRMEENAYNGDLDLAVADFFATKNHMLEILKSNK